MKAKYLILTLSLTLSAGAAVAAIKYGNTEPATPTSAFEAALTAIPRVVVTASRNQAADAPIARIVVVGHRAGASQADARSN